MGVFNSSKILDRSVEYCPFKFNSSLRMKSTEWFENDNQTSLFLKR